MRVIFADEKHANRLAKSLRKCLALRGTELKLSACQDLLAVSLGHARYADLLEACRTEPASPLDEELSSDEITARRKAMADAMETKGVPYDTAVWVLEQIRPTGRRNDGKPKSESRVDLGSKVNSDGFLWWEESRTEQHWFDIMRVRKVGCWEFGPDGSMLELDRSPNHTEGISIRTQCVRARLRLPDGTVGAAAHGFLFFSPHREDTRDPVFFDAADALTESAASMAAAMIDHYGAAKLFANGDLFWLMGWETALNKVPSGTGIAFLREVLKRLKTAHRTLNGIAVEIAPAQFLGSKNKAVKSTPAFRKAKERLARYWHDQEPERVFGPNGRTWHFEPRQFESRHDSLMATARYGFEPEELEEALGELDDLMANPQYSRIFSLFDEAHSLIEADQPERTTTLKSEPKPLEWEPDQWPANRAPLSAPAPLPRKFSVPVDFWKHMPTELSGITIDFYRAALSHPVSLFQNKLWRAVFRFANGTELSVYDHEFFHANRIPRALLTLSGEFLRVNPFTPRMSVADLYATLTANTGLLFEIQHTGGAEDLMVTAEIFRGPNRQTIIRRPPDLGVETADALCLAIVDHDDVEHTLAFTRSFCSQALSDGWMEKSFKKIVFMGRDAFQNHFEQKPWADPTGVTVGDVLKCLSPRTRDDCPAYQSYRDLFHEGLAVILKDAITKALGSISVDLRGAVVADLRLPAVASSDAVTDAVTRCPAILTFGGALIASWLEAVSSKPASQLAG